MQEERDMATSTETNTLAEAQGDTRQFTHSADSSEQGDSHDEDAWGFKASRCQDQLSDLSLSTIGSPGLAGAPSNTHSSHCVQAKLGRALQPRMHRIQQIADKRLNAQLLDSELDDTLESLEGGCNLGCSAAASVRRSANKQASGVAREKDKADRATYQTVLDPRTRLILVNMLNQGLFNELHGCVSTGKEANVYQASTADGNDLAVKIFKTSILTFKDRNRYVQGDFRFRTGYSKSNPRKMVKLWAEKEFRNLSRLHAAGVRCPQPVHLRLHVLVMEFVGSNGVAAPRLKDAQVTQEQQQVFYTQLVLLLREMYQRCHLVHADLSEYNILIHEEELWIIDVSQAVDLDHPRALDFLREDAAHINSYFRRVGVATLTTRELFEFVVDPNILAGNIDQAVEALMKVAASRPCATGEDEIAEKIFHEAYIPRRLEEVDDYEGDFERLRHAKAGSSQEGIYYQTIAGMRKDMAGATVQPAIMEEAQSVGYVSSCSRALLPPAHREVPLAPVPTESGAVDSPTAIRSAHGAAGAERHGMGVHSSSSQASSTTSSNDSCSDAEKDSTYSGKRGGKEARDCELAKSERKAHKAAVKESNRERRKQKVKKHIKKRAINKHKHK